MKTQPLATVGEDVMPSIAVKFQMRIAEFKGLLPATAPLWLGSPRNIDQSPVIGLALVHEATEMQHEETKTKQIKIIGIQTLFLTVAILVFSFSHSLHR